MGYRSDVTIVVKKDVAPKVLIPFAVTYGVDHFMEESGWKLYHFKWIKWYDSDEDIQMVMEALNQLKGKDYFFMRLGEEASDYEELGDSRDEADFPFLISPTYHVVYATKNFDSEMYQILESCKLEAKSEHPVLLNMLKDFIKNNSELFA